MSPRSTVISRAPSEVPDRVLTVPEVSPDIEAVRNSPLRIIAVWLAACMLFLRISMLHQIQTRTMHFNLRLLYIVGIPALLGTILAGGIQRSFKGKPAYFYTAYAMWIAIAIPFSYWRGGSFNLLKDYLRTDMPMLFMVAGLAITWRECRMLVHAVAWGAVVNLLSARLFANEAQYGYRGGMEFGSIANPNDFAGHLLLVLPFLLWVGLSSKNFIIKLAAFIGVAVGLKMMLGTASRGAFIGLGVEVLFFLWRGTTRQRIALLVLAPIAACAMLVLVPPAALRRIVSFSSDNITSAEQLEAIESSQSREYVLKKSIEYMFSHPIFGVGPGLFADYEGGHNTVIGSHGYWHDTHNSFTQAGSECGIPALCFLVGGILSTLFLLNKTYRETSMRPDCQDLRNAAFCIMLGFAGFVVATAFLNFAYFFYQPTIGGFAILLSVAARDEMRLRASGGSSAVLVNPYYRYPSVAAPK